MGVYVGDCRRCERCCRIALLMHLDLLHTAMLQEESKKIFSPETVLRTTQSGKRYTSNRKVLIRISS